MINLYVGYDEREACVLHTFIQSVIENTTIPVRFIPLNRSMLNNFDGQQDGTNAFIYSRYLIPHLEGYKGHALFCDGDMIANGDLKELWELRDDQYAVQVVQHEYTTMFARKYVGTPLENDNVDYPRKNWSSVAIWNCGHPKNRFLTPEHVSDAGGRYLHRFQWLDDDDIGDLPIEWNWLEGEYPPNPTAKLHHHTLGSPGFEMYSESPTARAWNQYLLNALHMSGERQSEMVRRAHWHVPGVLSA
jgi:hypothetical protein